MFRTVLAACVVTILCTVFGPAARADMTTLAAQYALRDTGDYRGPLDGSGGVASRAAIVAFQTRNGLDPSGTLDGRTLAVLGMTRSYLTMGIGRSLRQAVEQGFREALLELDWSAVDRLEAFHFAFTAFGREMSFVHVCGEARFPHNPRVPDRPQSFMMDLMLTGRPDEPPIAALLRNETALSDLWIGGYDFVEPFCALRVGSAVVLGLVR